MARAKHHNQDNLKKKGFIWGLTGSEFITILVMSMVAGRFLEQQLRAHIFIHKQEAERMT